MKKYPIFSILFSSSRLLAFCCDLRSRTNLENFRSTSSKISKDPSAKCEFKMGFNKRFKNKLIRKIGESIFKPTCYHR